MTKKELIDAINALNVDDSKELFIETMYIRKENKKYIRIRYFDPYTEVNLE
jgi:hypothetical protein